MYTWKTLKGTQKSLPVFSGPLSERQVQNQIFVTFLYAGCKRTAPAWPKVEQVTAQSWAHRLLFQSVNPLPWHHQK